MIETFEKRLDALRTLTTAKLGVWVDLLHKEETVCVGLCHQEEILTKVSEVFSRLGELARKDTIDKVELLLSYAVQVIMDDSSYKISIKTRELKTGINYEFFYSKRGLPEFPLGNQSGSVVGDCSGGGIKDIVSVFLDVIIDIILDPQATRFFILDERFKCLSAKYQPRIAQVIKFLSAKLGCQFLIITQQRDLCQAGDKVYLFTNTDGTLSALDITKEFVDVSES